MKKTPSSPSASVRPSAMRDQPNALAEKLDSLDASERKLAWIASLLPPEGAEKFVLRHLWTDYLQTPAVSKGKETFDIALRKLVRLGVLSDDDTGERIRATPDDRRLLQADPDGTLPGEINLVSDFLAAWLGFTPFTHARLRDFAKTSLLGHELAKEVRKFNQKRSERVRKLVGKPLDAAMAETGRFRPDGRHSPLIWAEFLERGDGIVFPGGDDPYFVRANLRRFLRRHWVYAFLNRGYGPMVNALFNDVIDVWNFFDRLVALQLRAAPAERLFAGQPEWRQEAEGILRRMEDAG